MKDLSLQAICEGMIAIRHNASELLKDAELLYQNSRISRSYALSYVACEEAGKLSILLGAATQIVLGIPVDWKVTGKRFRSHDSKASQFMGLASAVPLIEEAVAAEKKAIDVEDLFMKAAAGVAVGPALFRYRNASMYCDFEDGSFVTPDERINASMAEQMIKFAKQQITAANVLLASSAEETAANIAKRTRRDRYELVMSLVSKFAQSPMPPRR
ncbi:AbiV family abortive infection protein [Mesorhizobium sp. RSR565B]|uniref:AbiV family abortive infection protein n=1 Tax=unclassified Mesorhizobium TaxID=325217 RepID=UPI0003D02876|nr:MULTISPECIES: AbiV family abortive infection protein [unclassified Mesorhizobium]ESZ46655.1 hypothetical protein X730_20110 [Mesorhizobium sp. L103C565B0]ESZ62744.1 hypothetical protein X729_11445 [Mesorhizobium sp. L103C131B0]